MYHRGNRNIRAKTGELRRFRAADLTYLGISTGGHLPHYELYSLVLSGSGLENR